MVYYFNITGILNVKYENNNLSISRRWILWNFLSIFLITAAKCALPASVLSNNLRQEPATVDGITTFLITMLFVVRFELIIVAPFLSGILMLRLKNILNFMKACRRIFELFEVSAASDVWKSFIKKSRTTFFLFVSLSFIMRLIYFLCIFKTTWQASVVYLIFHWHNNIVYSFIISVSLFFPFFLLLLKVLNIELTKANELGCANYLDYDLLSSRFLELYHLILDFNQTFGIFLSITTEFIIFTVMFGVSM